jgi:hypothetical protein
VSKNGIDVAKRNNAIYSACSLGNGLPASKRGFPKGGAGLAMADRAMKSRS